MNSLRSLKQDLQKLRNPQKAQVLARFFKTGKGEYGEGDQFLGLTVPQERQVAKKYTELGLDYLQGFLNSKIHEYRMIALFVLINKYRQASKKERKHFVDFYLKNTKNVNNWDLVDLSASQILGNYLEDKDKGVLYQLARSKSLWEKRIAIIATFAFIRAGQFADTLKIAKILLHDQHDLIHKAVGWMLREVGKKNLRAEEEFLQKNYKTRPWTMLRYAIEKLDPLKRKSYLKS